MACSANQSPAVSVGGMTSSKVDGCGDINSYIGGWGDINIGGVGEMISRDVGGWVR